MGLSAVSDPRRPDVAVHGVSYGREAPGTERTETRFRHETLLYSGSHGFLEGTLPFIHGALEAEEPVLVAVGPAEIELLKLALGPDADRVSFTDMRLLGHNPARIMPAWHRFLEDNASENRPVRGIAEPIWPGRGPAELTECQRHEMLLNLAFDDGRAWSLLCPYDLDGLDEQVIEAARHGHPFITEDGVSRASDSCSHGDAVAAPFAGTLPPPPASAGELAFTAQELSALRRRLTEWASRFGLGCERTEHLVLAVTELTSNSVRHGGGGGTLQMWHEDEALLVEVRDAGHIEEPLVGRTRPGLEQPAGRGLWLVNHLCDLVQIRSAPGGSAVRVHMRLA
jgi:anti-sigma regulatory factor (Ser/Thr protein kinase)